MAETTKKKEGEAEGAKEDAAAAPAPKSNKKIIFIAIGLVVLLIAIGVPVALLTLKSPPPGNELLGADAAAESDGHGHDEELTAEGADEEEALDEGEEALGAIFPLDTFVVNLSGNRYIRVQVQLEFVERDVPRRFYTRLVPVRDGIIGLLATRSPDDLASQKGRDNLKNDLKQMVNEVLRKEEIKRVYFTQFVIQ